MAPGNAVLSIMLIALLLGPAGYALGDMYEGTGSPWPELPEGFDGEYIGFSFDVGTWSVVDVSVRDVHIIERISLPSSIPERFVKDASSFALSSYGYSFDVSDFSAPVIVYRANEDHVLKIELDSGVSLQRDDSGVSFEKSGVSCELVFDGLIDIRGKTLEIELKSGDILQLRFSETAPDSEGKDFDDALSDAISLKKVGAEACVKNGNFSAVSYNNLSIHPLKIEEKKMVFSVSGEERSGKSIIIHVSSGRFGNISVLLDGLPVEKGSYYDALFSSGDRAVYNLTVSGEDLSLLVYIPHFSEHTLTIEESSVSSSSATPVGQGNSFLPLLFALLLSIIAGVVLIMRKRGE